MKAAEKARDEAVLAARAARKTLDTFVKENSDPIARQVAWQKHQDWLNRPEPPPRTPEEEIEHQKWLKDLKEKQHAFMWSKVGIWWPNIENGNPIPFLDRFKWVEADKIGPLTKREVWRNATIATCLVKLGAFKSIGEAKQAGKDGPLKPGENRVKLGNSMKRIFME